MQTVLDWFSARGWTPAAFQRRAWEAYLAGRSGLIHAHTGSGKSLAVWLGPVIEWLADHPERAAASAGPSAGAAAPRRRGRSPSAEPIRVLWITPMRALAGDTVKSLTVPIRDLGLPWSVEQRTGDTSGSVKARQRRKLPTALVTTPESLSLLLSYPEARDTFATLRCVVVDEWHELLSTKRGTQAELALARLRRWTPGLRTWGLSATLGNLDEAMSSLLGFPTPHADLIRAETDKEFSITSILPDSLDRFPWSGHLGLALLEPVLAAIGQPGSTLLFTNTRSQAELWFRAIVEARPGWLGRVALHHGSLDRELRQEVEHRLKLGLLSCVVCTSSLDLGVDFSPVERVIQVGSPKGIARLLQRAGRSGHQPGAASAVRCVPTHALELLEFTAARGAAALRRIEPRRPLERPLDVLVQHLVTIGLGGGFEERDMLSEVRTAWSFRALADPEWSWCMDFVTRGGPALKAYPRYARLTPAPGPGGRYSVASAPIARLHRLGIGTISSDAAVRVRVVGGASLGTIEESFIARLSPGDRFVFAGRTLELVRVHAMTAFVRRASRGRGIVPRWGGGRSPLSSELAHAVRQRLSDAREGRFDDAEMLLVRPLLELQARWSRLPGPGELLIERTRTRDGWHVFLFPFEGRLVHEGLGALVAHRLSRLEPRSLSITVNDYGLEVLSPAEMPTDEAGWRRTLSPDRLLEDLLSCLNSTELTRRQFRDIARVAGLVIPGFPGAGKSARQLQASSELFFDVFSEFDPSNRLLDQARREVLEQQLEAGRLRSTLQRLAGQAILFVTTERLTPFSFPLWAERLRTQHVSSEKWSDRVRRMALRLEAVATKTKPARRRSTPRAANHAR